MLGWLLLLTRQSLRISCKLSYRNTKRLVVRNRFRIGKYLHIISNYNHLQFLLAYLQLRKNIVLYQTFTCSEASLSSCLSSLHSHCFSFSPASWTLQSCLSCLPHISYIYSLVWVAKSVAVFYSCSPVHTSIQPYPP